MNNKRPKWLKISLSVLAGWWSFWFCLIFLLAAMIGITDFFVPGDGLDILPGSILAVISLILTIVATIKIVKIQNRIMDKKSLKANYIFLLLLVILCGVVVPTPFIYTIF